MIKRLLGAVTDGFGLEVGRRLVDTAEDELDETLKKAEAEQKKKDASLAKQAKAAAHERARAAKLAENQKKEREQEIEAELAALKRRLKREG